MTMFALPPLRCALLVAAFVSASAACAQRVPPRIGYVYPAGGRQGATFTISVGGQSLAGATAATLSGSGVRVRVTGYDRPFTQQEINALREKLQQLQEKRAGTRKPGADPFTPEEEKELAETRLKLATRGARPANPAIAETLTLEVTVSPDAAPGEREIRVQTPNGLSNPMVFCIGTLPESTDPVVTATASPPRPNNPALQRNSAAQKKTERTIAPPTLVNGQILPGEVDRFRFSARQGQHVIVMSAARALIPYLADAVPGWFQPTLAVFDNEGREIGYADDFRFHPDPILVCAIPADGDYVVEIKDAIYRGREDFVYRLAIGDLPFVASIFPLGGRTGENLRVQTTGWNLPRNELEIETSGSGRGIYELAVRNQEALSNPVRFTLDERPALVETEPNNTPSEATRIALPVAIDARINAPGDGDVFQFEAAAPGRLVAEVLARRLNSPVDSRIEILDREGRAIAMNDDFEDKGAGLLTHHADSRLEFAVPAAGPYFVRVTDTQRHGGSEYVYRLRVGPPEPDFSLRIVPSTINVRAGSTVTLTAYALRRDGFEGEIALALKDAPKGFHLSGGRIPANQESVQLTLTAPPVLDDKPQNLTLFGIGTAAGKRIARVAVPADDMMQAFAYHHLVPAKEMKVQVAGRGTSLRILSRLPVQIPAGGTGRIRIGTPAARSVGQIKFELVEPPPGLAVVRCDRGADYVEVVVSCDAAKAKPGAQGNLILQAVGERAGPAKAKTKAKAGQRSTLGVAPAVPFDIPAPAEPFSD